MSQRQPIDERSDRAADTAAAWSGDPGDAEPEATEASEAAAGPGGTPTDDPAVVEVDVEPAGEAVLDVDEDGGRLGGHEHDELLDVDEEAEEAQEAVEADLDALAYLTAQRDEYLNALRHLQADFENYRKRMLRQQTEHTERAAESLVAKLLPVLDGFELAVAHGHPDLEPVYRSLVSVLEREGLERIDAEDTSFDPALHEAVAHEPSEGDDEPEVIEVMRAGYCFKGKVLRPAMVKVRG